MYIDKMQLSYHMISYLEKKIQSFVKNGSENEVPHQNFDKILTY